MADKEEGTSTTGDNPPMEVEQGPLVSVTFQKNPTRKQKYLEAQPKELGITQICLSLYQLSWLCGLIFQFADDHSDRTIAVLYIIPSVVVILAGSLAIAAKTLHIPTLRACFAMQIMAVAASAFTMILMLLSSMHPDLHGCSFDYERRNETRHICQKIDASSTVSQSTFYTYNDVGNIGNIGVIRVRSGPQMFYLQRKLACHQSPARGRHPGAGGAGGSLHNPGGLLLQSHQLLFTRIQNAGDHCTSPYQPSCP